MVAGTSASVCGRARPAAHRDGERTTSHRSGVTGTAVDAAGHAVTVWTDFRGNPGVTTPNQDTLVGTGY